MTSVPSPGHKLHRLLPDLCTARGKRSGKPREWKTHALRSAKFPAPALISSHWALQLGNSPITRSLFIGLFYSTLAACWPLLSSVSYGSEGRVLAVTCAQVVYAFPQDERQKMRKRAQGLPLATVALPRFWDDFWDFLSLEEQLFGLVITSQVYRCSRGAKSEAKEMEIGHQR